MTGGGEYSDERHPLRSNTHKDEEEDDDVDDNEDDVESQMSSSSNRNAFKDLFKHLDRGFSSRRLSFKRLDRDRDRSSPPSLDHHHHHAYVVDASDALGDSAPPEWALLLIGCLLGVASGLCVAVFNKGVRFFFSFSLIIIPCDSSISQLLYQ